VHTAVGPLVLRYVRNLVGRYVFLLKYVILESGLIFPFSYGLEGANLALDNKNYSQSLAGIEF
jgi:hypothetical protein